MTVIPLPSIPHLEIFGGVISSATVTDAKGTRTETDLVGQYRTFIDALDADGCRIGLWDGASYEDAVEEAKALSIEFGPIHDLIAGVAR